MTQTLTFARTENCDFKIINDQKMAEKLGPRRCQRLHGLKTVTKTFLEIDNKMK
jgi:hypothetical protein